MAELEAFANSLAPDDHVVVESTAVSWAVVDLLSRHAGRVTISNSMRTKAIASAKVKTDKVDAKVLAELGAAGLLAEVWVPDAESRELRRRLAHRRSIVVSRTTVRNRVQAILDRNLIGPLGRDGPLRQEGQVRAGSGRAARARARAARVGASPPRRPRGGDRHR